MGPQPKKGRGNSKRHRRGSEKRGRNTRLRRFHGHSDTIGNTDSFARVQVVEPGDSDLAQVDRLTIQAHVNFLVQHVHGTLGVPGCGLLVAVNAVLDTGSGVTSVSETLVRQLQREAHRSVI